MTSRSFFLFLASSAVGAGLVFVGACGQEPILSSTPTVDGGGGREGGRRSSTGSSGASGTTSSSGDPDPDPDPGPDGASPVDIDGGGPCGAYDFGKAAVPGGPVDTSDNVYDGGVLPPGIYDAVIFERQSGTGGSWRETFAIDESGRYTRIRQMDQGGGLGDVRHWAGQATPDPAKAQVTLKSDCAFTGGNAVDGGSDTFPYEVLGGSSIDLRYGLAGFRITLRKR
jgi:hypothetical protein